MTGTHQGITESRELEVYSEESDDQPWTIITCGSTSFFLRRAALLNTIFCRPP